MSGRDELARIIYEANHGPRHGCDSPSFDDLEWTRPWFEHADAVLASDWFAKHNAAIRAEAQILLTASPRFWSRVDVRTAGLCWDWQGPRLKSGYGRFLYSKGVRYQAHRFAWAIANGRMPDDDKHVCHTCDNPPGCNPAHLFEGTPRENFDDMVSKGRAWFDTERCPRGHEMTGDNLYIRPSGHRRCRECNRINQRKDSK